MRNFGIGIVLCAQIILTGCAAFGVVETSDPDVKLNDAENLLIDQDRPLPAEKLIYEAIEIYQKQGNSRGLGNAYRTYGDLLQSPSLTKWGSKNTRFHDESVTYENRAAKSQEYFLKALESYLKSEKQPLEAEQFDDLTNLYLNIAWVYFRLNDPKNSCASRHSP